MEFKIGDIVKIKGVSMNKNKFEIEEIFENKDGVNYLIIFDGMEIFMPENRLRKYVKTKYKTKR